MSELNEFRKQKDLFFKSDHNSPLSPPQKQNFDGLKYFPENPDLSFEAKIEKFIEQESIQMQTSTGDLQTYTKYGKIKFQVGEQEAKLTIFSNQHGFFLPFVDSQAGEVTYGAGRYLEPHPLPNEKILVDFNMAYNPYCAYNDLYSCPIPPAENRLNVPIEAGEKNFK